MRELGRVAVVTGGGQGLGRHVAEALVGAGYRVAVIGRTAAKLQRVAEASAGAILPVAADLSCPERTHAAFRAVDEAFGGVDVLINNAASYLPVRIDEVTDDEIALLVGANILSTVHCMREAVPRMRARGGGDILTVSSDSVEHPPPYLSLYAGAKAAVETISQGLRLEVRNDNIRVMVVRSGQIASEQPPNMPPERVAVLLKAFDEHGFTAKFMAGAAPPEHLAAAIVAAVESPRAVAMTLIAIGPMPAGGMR